MGKFKVSKKAEKELAQLCDKMYEWAKKYEVEYISTHIRRNSKTCGECSTATYSIKDGLDDYQTVYGKYDK